MHLHNPGELSSFPSGPLTVSEVIDLFLRSESKRYSAAALAERVYTLRLFSDALGKRTLPYRDAEGRLRPGDCRPADVVLFLDAHPSWAANWTIRGKLNQIQRPFNWAARLRLIVENPFQGVSHEEGDPRPPMTEEEFARLSAATDLGFRRLLLFLRLTWRRPGEACKACWPDVDWERGIVLLQDHKTRKQTKRPAVIFLVAAALELLREMRAENPEGKGHIFLTWRGTPWDRSSWGQKMRRLCKKVGIEAKSLACVRPQCGTQAVLHDAPLKLVSMALGHKSTAITEKHYVQIGYSTEEIDRIRSAMEEAMGLTKQARQGVPGEGNGTPPPDDLPLFKGLFG
jgi:integrase